MSERILLSSPHMSDEGYELEYINDAFKKNWIAPLGENVTEFEKAIAKFTGAENAVALSAGTAALHMAMILAGVQPGDEVFCQSLTFSASANPVKYLGANPVFIDSEYETWNMDPDALRKAFETHKKPKAVVAVHLYGNPAKLDEIMSICDEHGAVLIEDAAEAMGATWEGQPCGSFGDYAAISYNGNKMILQFFSIYSLLSFSKNIGSSNFNCSCLYLAKTSPRTSSLNNNITVRMRQTIVISSLLS